ncbi:unnamed protein product [Lepeophtheirus salmonis]|uniref:(salmon louse) hypothetical protein n=1 Tax=Lepeophtheirus salmonis TaxID=72036 RepID=A0A7R8HBW0_LEPSM|nr:unnamed protein product [Lepeophtheirus salmonis]CAF3002021.1 unnamed protein product [Lepeophtheirus salmonis]
MLGAFLRRTTMAGFSRKYHDQRMVQNRPPPGLTWASLKRHNSLMPLFIIMATGGCVVVAHCFRLIFLSPDEQDLENNTPFKLISVFDRERKSLAPRYKTMTEEEGEHYKYE